GLEVVSCDVRTRHSITFIGHLDVVAALLANFRLRKPEQKVRILTDPGGTNTRDSEEVKKRGFAEWEVLDRIRQRRGTFRPGFVQLDENCFNLGRMQRTGGFLFDPVRASHNAKDAATT